MSMTQLLGLFFVAGLVLLPGCSKGRTPPDPRQTVAQILAVHGVSGKDGEARTASEKKKRVDPETLEQLFVDYRDFDPFLAELYVGFVVGALARFQDQLVVEQQSRRARLLAGRVTVVMKLKDTGWQVDLDRSIPQTIKARAKLEQARLAGKLHRPPR